MGEAKNIYFTCLKPNHISQVLLQQE